MIRLKEKMEFLVFIWKRNKVLLPLMFLMLALFGCRGTRYSLGYRAGAKAYERGKKTGTIKAGYAVGFVYGFTTAKSLDDMDRSIKQLNDSIKSLENLTPKKKLYTDKEFERLLDEAEKDTLGK